MHIQIALSDNDVTACFPVMTELRPKLDSTEFLARVRRQQREGFQLAFVRDAEQIVAVAGFRFMEKLFSGRTLYVDDLVTHDSLRSKGYGRALFMWLVSRAREEGCRVLELDSGVQRFAAHRFYLRERMSIVSHHFALELDDK
ncbi:MAG TPA: GNAT family N-acetyltransferase [Polyangiaceae bacterium]|nr:GNAT family N-acetyltransferase [Polyangiaceae bacterium]